MTILYKGLKIPPQTILYVKFSSNGIEQMKCTSTNTYQHDAQKFADQFKKIKEVTVTINVISYHGKEFTV